jgi:AcrR family transcriptional regulator
MSMNDEPAGQEPSQAPEERRDQRGGEDPSEAVRLSEASGSTDFDVDEEAPSWSEGLRERKKRLTRKLISDTATAMFLERGFDDVKVIDVAEAAGVSEKTVYNYFPTKESLLFDREPEAAASIWRALGPGAPARSPVAGALEVLEAQIAEMSNDWSREGVGIFRRFAELVDATPSLQAAQREMSDRLERTAAEALAEQAGVNPDDPEPRIAAAALMGLWRLQYNACRRCALEGRTADETRRIASDEVARAARLVESGLWSFGAVVEGARSRQQLKAAGDAAQLAGRQVINAIRQARSVWEQLQQESRSPGATHDPRIQGLAAFLEQADRWKRDFKGQQDDWKQAYREQQWQLRQAQRELQQRFRQAHHEHRQEFRDAQSRRGAGPRGSRRPIRPPTPPEAPLPDAGDRPL